MKLSAVFAQYLYEHKRLDLPGLGTFFFKQTSEPELDAKHNTTVYSGNTSFESNIKIKENKELVEYISSQTGKFKALAAADLDTQIELIKQFLNIGKAYHFEGIGTLIKTKPGQFELLSTDDLNNHNDGSLKKATSAEVKDEDNKGFGELLMPHKQKLNLRKPAFVLLALFGIGLAMWGGYTVYKYTIEKNRTSETTTNELNKENISSNSEKTEPISTPLKHDSTNTQSINNPSIVTNTANTYKFVIEVAQKPRALFRFAHLNEIGVKGVQMETTDSITFKIFFSMNVLPADTSRIIDSLRRNYTPTGKLAFVE